MGNAGFVSSTVGISFVGSGISGGEPLRLLLVSELLASSLPIALGPLEYGSLAFFWLALRTLAFWGFYMDYKLAYTISIF